MSGARTEGDTGRSHHFSRYNSAGTVGDVTSLDYPTELVWETRTQDRRPIRIRPIRADDGPGLVFFHEHLSDQSVFRRYFTVHRHLSPSEVEHLTHVDYVDRLALVVEADGLIVGVGRYERLAETTRAEVAFVVADAFQHCGIGTLLLEHLARAARARGILGFEAETQAENRAMTDVFLHSGFPVTTHTEWGTVTIHCSIDTLGGARS